MFAVSVNWITAHSIFLFFCKNLASSWLSSWRQGEGRCRVSPLLLQSSLPCAQGNHLQVRGGPGLERYLRQWRMRLMHVLDVAVRCYYSGTSELGPLILPCCYLWKVRQNSTEQNSTEHLGPQIVSLVERLLQRVLYRRLHCIPKYKLALPLFTVNIIVPSSSKRSWKMRSHSSGMSALTWQGQRSFKACLLFLAFGW